LTDAVGALAADGRPLRGVEASWNEVMGVNSLDQLAEAESELHARIAADWMQAGVRIHDPSRVYIGAGVTLEPGAVLRPGVHLEGASRVGAGAEVGPDSLVVDSTIEGGAHVWYSVLRGATVGEGAEVGPYASLRPGTVLEAGAKAGTFVELKNSQVGPGAKVPHLSYVGDAEIGSGANVGAGTITCNFDGYEKHRTVIGPGAFIGSDTMLVAPVTVGENAVTGAGSVITQDVEPGALAIERSVQENIPGYAARRAQRQRKRQD
jgi:bifunctional UDP-N-acetylglucosamine pyrophosphorylase/glucosamine-1-phosphate N-acetyltransferase